MSPRGNRTVHRYKLTELDGFDEDYLHLVDDSIFEFAIGGTGLFRFGAMEATMDVEETERDGKRAILFTWEGFDEGDQVRGSGWAVMDDTGLQGEIAYHLGDTYSFEA